MKNKILSFTSKTTLLAFFFFLYSLTSFFIVRVIEYIKFNHIENRTWNKSIFWEHSIYLDFITCLYLSLILFLVLVCFSWNKKTILQYVTSFYFFIVIISQALLTGFFFSSKQLLGKEITKYSFSEALFVIKSGTDYSSIFIFILSIFLAFYFLKGIKLLNHKLVPVIHYFSIATTLTFIIIWNNNKEHLFKVKDSRFFNNILEFNIGNSKIPFFLTLNTTQNTSQRDYTSTELDNAISSYFNKYNNLNRKFPFQSQLPTQSTLSPYFKPSNKNPNIVYIIVESLSSAFSGTTNYVGSHTPFLDSLAQHSLVWVNTISCAEKTYGALPNILGSLPSGKDEKGFINHIANSSPIYPNFNTIYSLLETKGYSLSFNYPAWGEFDHTSPFLKQSANNIHIHDISHFKDYIKANNLNEKEYAWGYDDYTLFNLGLILSDYKKPFISTYLTLDIHSPFDHEPRNSLNIKDYLKSKNTKSEIKNIKLQNTIYLSDDAIKSFFQRVSSKKYFNNTIFIITGDHNIGSEIPLKSPIEQFRVPLIIYSPLLTQSKTFPAVVTHRDITPSIVGLLSEKYHLTFDKNIAFTGAQLDTSSTFRSQVSTSLSLYHQVLPCFIENEYYLAQDKVYKLIDDKMNSAISKNDSIKKVLKKRVKDYQILNDYALNKNKLIPTK